MAISTSSSPVQTLTVGALGAAIGVLVVIFMPVNWYAFTPETAATATGAFGVVFSWLARYLPAPPN